MIKEYQNLRVLRHKVDPKKFRVMVAINMSQYPLPYENCQYILYSKRYSMYVAIAIDDQWTNDQLKAIIHTIIQDMFSDHDIELYLFSRQSDNYVKTLKTGEK